MSSLRNRMQPWETRPEQLGPIGPMDPDVAAGRPVGQRLRPGRRAEGDRAVRGAAVARQLAAHMERSGRGWGRGRADADGRPEDRLSLTDERRRQRTRVDEQPLVDDLVAAEGASQDPARDAGCPNGTGAPRACPRPLTIAMFVVPSGVLAASCPTVGALALGRSRTGVVRATGAQSVRARSSASSSGASRGRAQVRARADRRPARRQRAMGRAASSSSEHRGGSGRQRPLGPRRTRRSHRGVRARSSAGESRRPPRSGLWPPHDELRRGDQTVHLAHRFRLVERVAAGVAPAR